MQLHQIEAVVAITEAGSFRKAAEILGRTQPTLTKSIKALEESVNLVIFDRTPRGVKLTEGGERLYKRACTIMADVRAMEDEVQQMAGLDGGRVRIGVSPVAGAVIMPRALSQFRKKWSRVEIDLINVLYPDSVSKLREAAIDMVLGPVPALDAYGNVQVERLFDIDMVITSHASNPKCHASRLTDLSDAQWIVHGSKDGPSGLFSGAFTGQEWPMPSAFTNCHSLTTVIALMQETSAFCVLSQQLFNTIAPSHEIVIVPVQDALPKFPLCLVTQKTRPLTPAAAELAQHIRRRATMLVKSGYSSDSHIE
ncbi:LysR family transcriptional regulator [uncultured Sulfitobacter sp.]|uniref:LysR family transcriptional regulator n=1 Tax=uncultured Sulfitobacter sp. TaxID=191468 RepID=UPI00260C3727|nr:LysR family transcriptional regulator [uncultured Sulfitobacter sp.]